MHRTANLDGYASGFFNEHRCLGGLDRVVFAWVEGAEKWERRSKMSRKEIVLQIQMLMRHLFPTAEVILYGSEARGEARPDSDIDLLILVDGDKLTLAQEDAVTTPLYELELQTGVVISPIVMLKKQWENRPLVTPFYLNVMKEGVRL